MTQDLIDRSRKRHTLTDVALVALIIALVAALAVAAVVVSIGMARADTLGHFAGSGRYALPAFLGLVVAGMGGLTAAVLHNGEAPPRRD